jgi:hypothetical protein
MKRKRFLELADELGYQAHAWHDGFLLASVDPDDAARFDGCVRRPFEPEALTAPGRQRVEVTRWPRRRKPRKNARKRALRLKAARYEHANSNEGSDNALALAG